MSRLMIATGLVTLVSALVVTSLGQPAMGTVFMVLAAVSFHVAGRVVA